MRLIIGIIILLSFSSCEKIKYYDRFSENIGAATRTLAHKGNGECGFTPNTLEAVYEGLKRLDGIEVDVQISINNTVWLSHDYLLPSCGNYNTNCFRETSDNSISQLDSCLGPEDNFTRLEEVFKLMADSFPDKYISIDAKAWTPCDIGNIDMIGELNVVADGILQLTKKHGVKHVMVESETATFLTYIKNRNKDIETYLTAFGDFDRGMGIALEKGFSGISFEYMFKDEITSDHISLLHKHGLKIQLWTLESEEILEEAISIKPDFIQTDLCNIPKVITN